MQDAGMAARQIVFLAFPDLQALDLVGPLEVFDAADRISGGGAYEIETVAPSAKPFKSSSGLTITADSDIANFAGRPDTLVVAGGTGVAAQAANPAVVEWVRRTSMQSRRVASVCSGAFILGAAGLLDGRKATTHWVACDRLQEDFPAAAVEPDRIFTRDGELWTSAGVSSGIDLALAMVEDDLGASIALEVARWLVVYLKRPGGQAQFSTALAAQRAERPVIRELQDWIAANLGAELGVEALAERAHMSARNLTRAFRAEFGTTPASYVEQARVEWAQVSLRSTKVPIEEIARLGGFGTPETMRRAFARRLRVAPSEYRGRFRSALEPDREHLPVAAETTTGGG